MTHQLQFCYSKHEKKIKSPVNTEIPGVNIFYCLISQAEKLQ
jgi:hypothetical protein